MPTNATADAIAKLAKAGTDIDALVDQLIAAEDRIAAPDGLKGITDAMDAEKLLRKQLKDKGVDPDHAIKSRRRVLTKPTRSVKTASKRRPTKPVANDFEDLPWEDDDGELPLLDSGYSTSSTSKFAGVKSYGKCAHTHPLLTIDGLSIQGGACSTPQHGPYDIEIGFCGSWRWPDKGLYPWTKTQYVFCPIPDMGTPHSFDEFDKLIDWTIEQMKSGKKVHCGCIGGHGRTGLFLSAIVRKLRPDDADSITWLRAHYCKKAVESTSQVAWLNKHYGIKKVAGAKSGDHSHGHSSLSAQDKSKLSGTKFGGKGSSFLNDKPASHVTVCLPGKSIFGSNRFA